MVILSDLYGVVLPFIGIKAYRLDMGNSITPTVSLYKLWSKVINDYFDSNEPILNLASKEYAKILTNKRMYHVDFLDLVHGEWKSISYHAKHMRGIMACYVLMNQVELPDELRTITLSSYCYSQEDSSQYRLVYKRR